MQQDKEIDFIRRKYCWHLLSLFLTLLMIAFILGSDIKCIKSELDLSQLICTILEIIFCLLVFILTCMELRYFYKVKHNNFTFTYTSIISQGCLKIIIVCLIIIYLANLIIELIYDVQLTNNQRHNCHYFGFTNQIYQFIISGIILICQLIMMFIPYKISKTLISLSNQKKTLFQDIFLSDLENDFQDITANNGNFCIIMAQKQQNICSIPSSQLNKCICKLCTSKIKNKQLVTRLLCTHLFHDQCFQKYVQSIMRQKSFVLTCPMCDQGVNGDKQTQFIIYERKSKGSYKH
ncbi:unnamed protein product [Paramecium octaurelia]|uniref:RING-type domain-containing protein n=1 Tax=Paramecium octaurelia TaxID=43137 RepID=A0A8S1UWK1_PAROT|nr:unnamed protein product [Paramecium octaurelia]